MFVLAEVRDNGVGIPRETIGKVGEPFFTTKEQRAGLGFAIVRRIVSRHRGRIEIESDTGKGTAVRIILPRDPNSR
jgi:signal transduction histidine kinase